MLADFRAHEIYHTLFSKFDRTAGTKNTIWPTKSKLAGTKNKTAKQDAKRGEQVTGFARQKRFKAFF